MEINTNGAITPEEAIRNSAKILVEQLMVFAQLEARSARSPTRRSRAIRSSIRSCCVRSTSSNSPVRSANCLKAENIYYIAT